MALTAPATRLTTHGVMPDPADLRAWEACHGAHELSRHAERRSSSWRAENSTHTCRNQRRRKARVKMSWCHAQRCQPTRPARFSVSGTLSAGLQPDARVGATATAEELLYVAGPMRLTGANTRPAAANRELARVAANRRHFYFYHKCDR